MKRGSSLRLIEWPIPPISADVRGVGAMTSSSTSLPRPGRRRGVLDGLDDIHVAGAPAKIPGDRFADVAFGRIRIRLQERVARQHHARRAVAALQAMLL